MNNIQIYDEECYCNIWTNMMLNVDTGEWFFFEVSDRVNQIEEFRSAMRHWAFHKFTQVGFNNIGYDYPVVHAIMTDPTIQTAADIFAVSKGIIDTPWNDRFSNRIPPYKHIVKQIDLFLVHHFDNPAKSTSLKMLEFVMRMKNIQDLPFKPETYLTHDEMDVLIAYQRHDIDSTYQFYLKSIPALEFRETLSEKYGKDFMNHNDGKIGNDYFIMELEKAGVQTRAGGQLIQTYHDYIDLGEVIFPYIKLEHPEFQRVLNEIRTTRIYETKGSQKWSAVIDGFSYDLGLGGIHGSVSGQIIHSNEINKIEDADFKSWYPHLSFKNNVYPEHLGEPFCPVYSGLYDQRDTFNKDQPENLMLKLALNIAYGNSNSVYSPFYDPKFTMTITLNGQLILCMLAEQLIKIPQLKMIQVNTDGLTFLVPRKYDEQIQLIYTWIQQLTQVQLESVEYSTMAIRDVNNYIAVEAKSGKTKYNGAYDFKSVNDGFHKNLGWHQNHSALVVRKAAAAALTEGKNVREFIMNHDDIFDFFLCTKVSRNDNLVLQEPVMWGDSIVFPKMTTDTLQNITRYYISNTGSKLVKMMKPLKRKTTNLDMVKVGWLSKKLSGVNKNLRVTNENEYKSAIALGYRIKDGGSFTHTNIREIGIDKDWLITPINNITDETKYDINFEYYITEAEKLVNKIL